MTRPRASGRFEWPVRVYWEDTDGGGIVYHANYLAYMERARSEWLRARGVDQGRLRDAERVQFAVVEMNVKWQRAARYDDLLVATVEVTARGGATLEFAQSIRRGDEVLVAATVRVAAVDADTLRPRRMPAAIDDAIDDPIDDAMDDTSGELLDNETRNA